MKFLNLLKFTARKDATLQEIIPLIPENGKYTSPDSQNEIIDTMAEIVRDSISKEVKSCDADCFTIKCDGMRDRNNRESLSIVVRFVKNGQAKERLLEIALLDKLDAKSICSCVLNSLRNNGLDPMKILSQCYDGASVMGGHLGGVQRLLQNELGKEVPYIHCFNHQLHLVIIRALEVNDFARHFFDMCDSLYKFTRRYAVAVIYKGEKLKRLLETRWTGHLATVDVIRNAFEDLVDVLSFLKNSTSIDAEIVVLSRGFLAQLNDPKFRPMAHIIFEILSLLQPGNVMLQSKSINLMHGVELIRCIRQQLQDLRTGPCCISD